MLKLKVTCGVEPCYRPMLTLVDDLYMAIRAEWPKLHPEYWAMVHSRYRGISKDDALKCVREGYSSPSAAMGDGVIAPRHLRAYIVRVLIWTR
jgi:hypothetical protein